MRNLMQNRDWNCTACGATNQARHTSCVYCAAARPVEKAKREDSFAYPPEKAKRDDRFRDWSLDGPFVLFPANQRYVDGYAERPAAGMGTRVAAAGCTLVFMVPFVLAGLFLIGTSLWMWREYVQLSRYGQIATGMVIDTAIDTDDEGTSYSASYRFTVNGETYRDSTGISSDEYARLGPESTVYVLYLPGEATTSRLVAGPQAGLPLPGFEGMITLFTVCWNTLILGLVIGTITGLSKVRTLEARGYRIDGVVEKVDAYDSDDDFVVRLHYRGVTPEGVPFTGKVQNTRNDLRKEMLPEPGMSVVLWYADEKTHTVL